MRGIDSVKGRNKSRNGGLEGKATTTDKVNDRMNALKMYMKQDSSPMIKLKRSSDLLAFHKSNPLADFEVASQVPTERKSDTRSYSLHPRSINMKHQLSAAAGKSVVPGRLNEMEYTRKHDSSPNQLPQVPSSRYLQQKLLPDFVEMDKRLGSQKGFSQVGSHNPRQSMLEKSQSEVMLNDVFTQKLSMANVRAHNNFSSTITKPGSIYKTQKRLFDPSTASKQPSRLVDNQSEIRS